MLVGWMCCLGSQLLGKKVLSISQLIALSPCCFPPASPHEHSSGQRAGSGCKELSHFMLQPGLGAGWDGSLLCAGSIPRGAFGMSSISLPVSF